MVATGWLSWGETTEKLQHSAFFPLPPKMLTSFNINAIIITITNIINIGIAFVIPSMSYQIFRVGKCHGYQRHISVEILAG